jgi:hypothetical protein
MSNGLLSVSSLYIYISGVGTSNVLTTGQVKPKKSKMAEIEGAFGHQF